MSFEIIDRISSKYVPKFGNEKKFIYIHYLGVTGENYELAPDGTGAHFTIYHDGRIYQRCDLNAIVWAVGTANGSYKQKHPVARNANGISIELCCYKTNDKGNKNSPDDKDWYFTTETQEAAVWLVQKLMKECNIPAENVLRHFDVVNKTCPAPYVHNNKYKTSWTWEEFKNRISGKTETAQQAGKGIPASKEAYIEAVAQICVDLYPETKILPSVVIAQCCLETGFGLGADSSALVKVNNLLGMKSELLNSTWKDYFAWDGKSQISKITPEYHGGKMVYITDYFRAYPDYRTCILDYERFLLYVKLGANYKYRRIQGVTDPATFLDYLYNNGQGYATDPNYRTKVLKLISDYGFRKYDDMVLGTEEVEGDMAHPWLTVMKGYNTQLKEMVKDGIVWRYSNSGCKTTWKSAIKNKVYKTNCAQAICWVLRNQKILTTGQKFYNNAGVIAWKDAATEKNVKATCDIIDVKGKKLSDLVASGTIQAGDIVMFSGIVHMCMYAGNSMFYDAGTCYEATHGEGALFKKGWYGKMMYGSEPVKLLIRKKGTTPSPVPTPSKTTYRVQAGAYVQKSKAEEQVAKLKAKKFDAFIEKSGLYYKVICGSYTVKANASARLTALKKSGFDAFIQ